VTREEGEAQSFEFYANDFRNGGFKKYSSGNYALRNRILVRMLKKKKLNPKRIVEVAGAEGDLAEKMLKNFHIEKYIWSDFCNYAVRFVKKKLSKFGSAEVILLDADRDWQSIKFKDYDCFVSTSLEHLENDLKIISSVKAGTLVVLSLPSFNAIGHVRFFRSEKEVYDRYFSLLKFLCIEKIYATTLFEIPANIQNLLHGKIRLSYFIRRTVHILHCPVQFNRLHYCILARRKGTIETT